MSQPITFFDLATLGSLRRLAGSGELERLDIHPDVHDILSQLQAEAVRLGVTTGLEDVSEDEILRLLEQAGVASFFSQDLILVGSDCLIRAAQAGGDASVRVFVSEDHDQRGAALEAALRVAPHPRFAAAALRGMHLRYVRVNVPTDHAATDWRGALSGLDIVPFHVVGEEGTAVYAIATSRALAALDDLGFETYRLGGEDEPLTTEVYLLRDDLQTRTGFLVPEGASTRHFSVEDEASRVLASTPEGLYVAVPGGRSVESYHFEEARHGHTQKLAPDPSLLQPFGLTRAPAWLAPPPEEPVLDEDERRALSEITPGGIAADLARYTGEGPLDDSGARIGSRHIFSPDNPGAVQALVRDLQQIGGGALEVGLHQFFDQSRPLHNVEAEMRGAEPDEMVLVTAHLDSTAAFSKDYDPLVDQAPGADDDGSGMVAVLAIARALSALRQIKPLKRSIRFVLFNAEEQGLVGSIAYARAQAAVGAVIVAVFQMDMIGYNRQAPKTFEVHAGFLPSSDVQERSRLLAERVGQAARQVSPGLPPPQIYLSGPQEKDPAEERSDHASFHLRGYAACCISEDFFAGPREDPAQAEPNPDYHKTSDTFVDVEYAADLARAVGAAAWLTANL